MKLERRKIKLDDLVLSSALCPRAELSTQHTVALADAVLRGCSLPPLKVVCTPDGRALLYGGYHTYRALRLLEVTEVDCEVTEGAFDDAVWLSCLENRMHGRPRGRLDTYLVVKRALAHSKAASMSYPDVAHALNVPLGVVLYIARHDQKVRFQPAKAADAAGGDCIGEIKVHIGKLRNAIDSVLAGSAKAPGANLAHAKVFQKLLAAMQEEVERWELNYGDEAARVPGKSHREDTRVHQGGA